jgi:hypothetical protein
MVYWDSIFQIQVRNMSFHRFHILCVSRVIFLLAIFGFIFLYFIFLLPVAIGGYFPKDTLKRQAWGHEDSAVAKRFKY